MKNGNLLIIFTKQPVKGKVKTRLAEEIGDEKALQIYEFLLDHSKKTTLPVEAEKRVYYAEGIAENDIWNEGSYIKHKQIGGDLGERMYNAFRKGFEDQFKRIVIVGTDLLDIRTQDIEMAFRVLKEKDFVIGPANDGGYYLLGMNSLNSEVFKNKNWSTSSVFRETLKDMEGKSLALLPMRKDVDILEDIVDEPIFEKILNK